MRARHHLLAALLVTSVFTTTARAQLYAPAGPGATLYVANSFGGTIESYNPPSGNGTQFGGSANNPYGLAFDSADNLYVANGNTIILYTNTGGVLSNAGTQFTNSGLSGPTFLAFAPAPEPTSTVLLLAGLVTAAQRRRRKA